MHFQFKQCGAGCENDNCVGLKLAKNTCVAPGATLRQVYDRALSVMHRRNCEYFMSGKIDVVFSCTLVAFYNQDPFDLLFECFINVFLCMCVYVCVSLAFVTLLNGDQAQDAIRTLHQTSVRGRDVTVQLQPTDSLLCVTNLPYTVTASQFQELVRSYGNIERCFLVHSDLTGHSKGYGFVEYMKKDSASRARSELLGKPLGDRALMVQWADVNQLTSADHLHSKCLCVDRLPLDFEDSEELAHIFSESYKPVFCQVRCEKSNRVFVLWHFASTDMAGKNYSIEKMILLFGEVREIIFLSPTEK
uniref:RRM domain-containing protein n=1 Tax=Sinocyclocheilus anshuiensis TaxID=1608454 RepID=A0A671SGY6_9TELE